MADSLPGAFLSPVGKEAKARQEDLDPFGGPIPHPLIHEVVWGRPQDTKWDGQFAAGTHRTG